MKHCWLLTVMVWRKQIWDIKGQTSKLVCEIKEHKKVVTCFTIFEPGDNLLSGSFDKTVRVSHLIKLLVKLLGSHGQIHYSTINSFLQVWQMLQKKFECLETIEVKEPVHNINTFGERIFVATQSRGLKVNEKNDIIVTNYNIY